MSQGGILQEDVLSNTSGSTNNSMATGSQLLLASHTINLALYRINLATPRGPNVFVAHLVLLPLLPILVILIQNASIYGAQVRSSQEVVTVKSQVQARVTILIALTLYKNAC